MLQNKEVPEKIKVIVRKRPINKKEIQKNDIDIIETRNLKTIVAKELKNKVDMTKYIEEHHFTFDRAFDENSTNENIYLDCVRPLVETAFVNKAKITCFAYGQTGSGKTHTMMGNANNPGLYLLSAYDIFNFLEQDSFMHLEIWVSFYEIYCGKLYDLLNERNLLVAREDGNQNICIVGLQEKQITNIQAMMQIIEYGLKARTVGVTGANMDSSRSHGILQIGIKEANGNPFGKISFIDLAGSERAHDTIDTNRQTRIDGAEINKSLLALKECIRAIDQEKKHTPFRGSKLTLVLRDSFIGNSRTLMIANISPSLTCTEHTLNTLRYADRVKELRKDKDDNSDKDTGDELAKMLMLPRQHGKTVKYEISKVNEKRISTGITKTKSDNKGLSNNNIGGMHINQLFQAKDNKDNKNDKHYSVPKLNNNYTNLNNMNNNNNVNFNNLKVMDGQKDKEIIKNHNPYSKNKQIENKERNNILEMDINKLSEEHEKLIQVILKNEEDLISDHRTHIDDMVEIVKEEMNLINEVDKPGSDIDIYVNHLDKILEEKEDRIKTLRNKLKSFSQMLKREEMISQHLLNHNDAFDVFDLNNEN